MGRVELTGRGGWAVSVLLMCRPSLAHLAADLFCFSAAPLKPPRSKASLCHCCKSLEKFLPPCIKCIKVLSIEPLKKGENKNKTFGEVRCWLLLWMALVCLSLRTAAWVPNSSRSLKAALSSTFQPNFCAGRDQSMPWDWKTMQTSDPRHGGLAVRDYCRTNMNRF